MSETVIKAESLGKKYTIGHESDRERYTALRDVIMRQARGYWRKSKDLFRGKAIINGDELEEFWALRDVSFEVKQGEVLGIIGRNGAGKSTLLKVLSRITEPSEGRVTIKGRVASLLEVGTGFHPELTGRENIYLNGAILGMSRREIKSKFDEIVAFAEVEKYLDTPVKRYSSGMYVRLAFAVAAHLEPEILLVDEVLAVGDAEFQKKCLGKMREVSKGGRTVLFVSHNMGAVKALCPKTMLLEQGAVLDRGDTGLVTSAYLTRFQRGFDQTANNGDAVIIEKVELKNAEGINTVNFAPGSDLTVEIQYSSSERFEQPYFWVGAYGRYGPVFGANMLFDGCRPNSIDGRGVIRCVFREIPLLPTTYTIKMGCRARDGTTLLMESKDVGFFEVTGRLHNIGFYGEIGESLLHDSCTVAIPYDWTFPDGTVHPIRIRNPNNNGSKHE